MNRRFPGEFISNIVRKGYDLGDNDDTRLKKAVLTIIAGGIALLAIFWGCLYIISGYPVSAAIPLCYALISFCSLTYFFLTKRFEFFRFSQFLLILLLPFILMWSLGGFANSSGVMIWAIFTPLAALFFCTLKTAARWLVAFLLLTAVSGIIDPYISAMKVPMGTTLNTVYFVMNLGMACTLVFFVLHYFVKDRMASHLKMIRAKEQVISSNEQLQIAVQKLQKNENKIRELMLTDSLTGIANRRYLEERIISEIQMVERYNRVFSIIMIDIDHFKQINDTHGHTVGDEVLKTFCEILKNEIRVTDFLARYGGEEFVILLPEIDGKSAFTFAQRLRHLVESETIQCLDKKISASFGVTEIQEKESTLEVIKRVDQALYQAKELGRNCVVIADAKGIFYQMDDLKTNTIQGWKH